VQHGVDLARDEDEIRYVVPDKREIRVAGQMGKIFRTAGDEIVHADHLMTFGQQAVAEMRAEEAGCASDEYSHR